MRERRSPLAASCGALATCWLALGCTYDVPEVAAAGDASVAADATVRDAGVHDQATSDQATSEAAARDAAFDARGDDVASAEAGCRVVWVGSIMATNCTNNCMSASASLTLPAPASSVPGDVLLAYLFGESSASMSALTAPTGWAFVGRADDTTDDFFLAVYSKVTGVGEPTSYTWTVTDEVFATMWLLQYTGVDPVNPVDVQATRVEVPTTADASVFSTASISTAGANELVIATFAGGSLGDAPWTVPAGLIQRISVNTQELAAAVTSDEILLALPGTAGPFVASLTLDGGANAGVFTVLTEVLALRPCP